MPSLLYSPIPDTTALVRKIVLSPFLSGPLLLAAAYSPDTLRRVIFKIASLAPQWFPVPTHIDISTIKTALRVIFGLSIVRQVNHQLNIAANNSWRFTASKGWDWPNEIAVVTGGSSGIGKNITEKLVALGVRVAVLDIQEMPKDMQGNPRIRYFHCDVTSSESVMAAADEVRREMGHASILVNNAGISRPFTIANIPEKFLRKTFDVNVLAHWFTTQAFLPHMIEVNKGHIVTIASIASFVTLGASIDYSATKAAVLSFHEGLASELKHTHKANNVLTTVVHPSFVRTPLINDYASMLENSGVKVLTPEQVAEPVVAQIKSRRGGQLMMPFSSTLIYSLRSWPTWMQVYARDFMIR